jgi:hypothetical protein
MWITILQHIWSYKQNVRANLPKKSLRPISSPNITSIDRVNYRGNQKPKIEGWKVVIVGDKKTPSDWNYTNCVYLSIEKQKNLGYRIHDLVPYGHYGRKNFGYLYAIQHGARVIYETDDDNMLILDDLSTFYPETAIVSM